MLAIREALHGEIVGADSLIAAGLRALLDDVDSPSLPLIAGLTRREEGEAHDLFRAVAVELSLVPPMPVNTAPERWRLVQWLCEALVDGTVEPDIVGRLIWIEGWEELGRPVGLLSEWDDWQPFWTVSREQIGQLIVNEAVQLLNGSWPPK
ncbi:hypothetical protein ACIQC5_10225 [Paenarthrobacter sp. NPDC092416]|uniref:hypothetical protein n=1 Tax=Paenarthrobacter sp. NPDC092416 TaxID=3364386 RepID=UPI0038120831